MEPGSLFCSTQSTLCPLFTPSIGQVLVASSEVWTGSSEWEQAGKVPPGWYCQPVLEPTFLKGFWKKNKCRMCRRMTNVIWRLEKTLARDRMRVQSVISPKREPER